MAGTSLLSPRRYLRQGFGLALPDNFSYSTLRSVIVRAQDQVTRYCNAPKQPNPFDWRGGSMLNEQHQWKVVNPLAYGPGARRVYSNAGPIKAITALTIDLGLTAMISIPTNNVYVNTLEQYVEVIALSPTVIAYYPQAVLLGLYNPVARISYTYGWSFPITGDVLEAESPTQFSAAYGNWDSTVVPAVYFDGVVQSGANYTVDHADGTITFTLLTAPGPGVEVTADYTYLAPSAVVNAIGLTTTTLLGNARMAQRGLTGLQSIRVAEVALMALQPSQMVTKNGASIPAEAASLLDGAYTFGSAFG